jgi:fructose-bisphosphate aldolase class I
VLLDGNHTVVSAPRRHKATLQDTYEAVARYNVARRTPDPQDQHGGVRGTIRQRPRHEVAERTVRVLKNVVPAAQPGIVVLSGGQSDEAATAHLNAMAAMKGLPWPLTFSYSRALQNPALKSWKGQAGNVAAAQKAFHHRAHMNALAAQGKWKTELERQAA